MKFIEVPKLSTGSNPHAPLAGVVEFVTDKPAHGIFDLSDGEREWSIRFDNEFQKEHRYPVLGLRPGKRHTIRVRARDRSGDGAEAGEVLEIRTDPLPGDFPPIEVTHCDTAKREPGFIAFNVRHSPATKDREDFGLILIIDQDGEIVWYYRSTCNIGDVRRLQSGNLLFVTGDHRIVETDLLGNTLRHWYAAARWEKGPAGGIPLDMAAIHHQVIELPSGNLVAMGMEQRQFPDYPTSDWDPGAPMETANVVGDVLVEFRPDGTIVNRWKMLDILDPYRMVYGTLGGYWVTRGFPDTRDWSHCNGVAYDGSDDSLVVSLRTQDALVKIGRDDGQVKWILGPHGGWKSPWDKRLLQPQGEFEWNFHQHDPSITPDGTLTVFDNGNFRALPPDKKLTGAENYSRAVEFSVDPENMTVKQAWAYGAPGSLFATYQGGVIRLPRTGNVFINYGGLVRDSEGNPSDNNREDHCSARLLEVTYAAPHEKVFELVIDDQSGDNPAALSSFRAEYFPDLYP